MTTINDMVYSNIILFLVCFRVIQADLPVQLEQICAPTFSEMPAWTWLVLSPSCARMR